MPDLPRIRDKYYKQFDKYFIFVEQAIRKTKDAGYICYIVPNKFFKVGAGEHLRSLIAKGRYLVSLDDFGDAQLFEDKTIYSSILLLCKSPQEKFRYTGVDSADKLWVGEEVSSIEFGSSILNKLRMAITQGRDGSKSYLSLFIITANNPFNPKQLRSAIAVSVFVLGKYIDLAKQILKRDYNWKIGTREAIIEHLEHRLFFPQEIAGLLSANGFEVVELFDKPEPHISSFTDIRPFQFGYELSGRRLQVIAKAI